MNYAEFEKKVKSMTAHDIIMTMVEGLRQPRTKIDMNTFGLIKGGICYGCAATNAILHIMNANEEEVKDHVLECEERISSTSSFLDRFEMGIDRLRRGWVDEYNRQAMYFDFAQITPMPGLDLLRLGNNYTEEQLQQYEKLAKYQLTRIK